MFCLGTTDWVVTNQRIATRAAGGQVISIRWAAISGLTVDLVAEVVVLDGANGYHGELRGPTVATVAVVAVAACFGTQALMEAPSLGSPGSKRSSGELARPSEY
jgi:hypothetical protein